MELSVTLNYGPLNAEFSGGDQEEIQDGLVNFVEFLETNDLFDGMDVEPTSETPDGTPGVDSGYWEKKANQGQAESQQNTVGTDDRKDSVLYPIARKVGASVTDLEELVYVDEEGEEEPQLLIDEIDRLGDTVPEKQRGAALILLLAWHECYDEEKMKTSKLKDILAMRDISTNNLSRAWDGKGEGWFDPRGMGPSATIKLRGPGKRQARSVMKDLVEEVDSE